MDFELVADGLKFPEGPVFMEDGSIILVEIAGGLLTRAWGDGKKEVIADMGGGPNGAAIGPDGAIYVCNNGKGEFPEIDGLIFPGHADHEYSGGRIERVDPATGKVERLFDEIEGIPLRAPNDIVFDKEGGFYFTDLGKSYQEKHYRDMGGLFYVKMGAKEAVLVEHGLVTPNGVGLSPDQKTLYYADSLQGKLWAYDLAGPGDVTPHMSPISKARVVATMPSLQYFDSLAVTEAGNVCVATLIDGGITSITPDGEITHHAFPDLFVTNICFGGEDMRDAYLTLSSTGQLVKCRWPEPGLKLNF